jgi:signal transduction histidine kinase
MIDTERLTRCVINLISNAAEVMVGRLGEVLIEGRTPCIDIETWYSSMGIFVAVSDNGPGISPENLSRIREPLFTTKSFGTGLGLPAVDKIMEQHGGALDVASVPGEGATFTIRLPHPQQESSVA